MITMIIIAALMYIVAGLLFTSNILIMSLSSDEDRARNEVISNRNFKTIGFLMIAGIILEIIWVLSLKTSFIIGIGILLGSFLIGVFIRIILYKKNL